MTSKAKHKSSNTVWVIGENYFGQLGGIYIGDMQSVLRTLPKDITNIYTGRDFSIFRDIHNNYYSAGYNQEGSCATDTRVHNNANIPFSVVNTSSLNVYKMCVNVVSRAVFWITSDNKIYANGSNSKKQLGLPAEFGVNELTLLPCFTDHPILDIQPAADYTIILGLPNNITVMIIQYWAKQNETSFSMEMISTVLKYLQINKVYCAGESDQHTVSQDQYWNEIVSFQDKNIVKIRTGYAHSLFLQDNGAVWSCGRNDCGQTGINSLTDEKKTDAAMPMAIDFFGKVQIRIKDIECGAHHSLAIDMYKKAYSWGLNTRGQCGNGDNKDVFTPGLIKGLVNYKVIKIDCGCVHSYCQTIDGKHWLFGSNSYNECVTYDLEKSVILPFCINDMIREKTGGGEIESISLGQYSTIIVVYDRGV